MKVVYGNVVNLTVDDNVDQDALFEVLKGKYSELANATYSVDDVEGTKIMTITPKAGTKAAALA